MQFILYKNSSERQAINKTISDAVTLNGTLRSETSVTKPSIMVELENPSAYNYAYIPEFGRYYFIDDMVSVRYNLWRIECSVDVLMSFKNEILALPVIIADNTSPDQENYMSGDVWATTVKNKTDAIVFPSGLLETGEYILITSGGVAS